MEKKEKRNKNNLDCTNDFSQLRKCSFLPKQAIIEYKKLYHEYYDESLTLEEATTKAESLLGFYNEVVFGKKLEKEEDQPMN